MRTRHAALLAWALVATVLSILWAPRGAPPAPRAFTSAEIPRLRRRVAELEEALAQAIPPPPPAPDGAPPRVEDLFAAARRLSVDPDATTGALRDADRALHALLAHDASAHAALARMLPGADEDAAQEILAALVFNPFVRSARSMDATAEVLGIAAACLRAEQPHVRAAAAALLLGYASPPEPPQVRLALDALDAEDVPAVREAMLAAVAERARGVSLTEVEARPLVAELRQRVAHGETAWLSALADWSGSEEDFGRAEALFRAQRDAGTRHECLNAFRREARLVEGRAERAEALLREAMLDASLDEGTRGLARQLLDGYAPWGEATAEVVRRYEELTR